MKVAITHDWITGMAGAERVLQSLLEIWPGADVYTSRFDSKKAPEFKKYKVITSFLNRPPFSWIPHQMLPQLRPLGFESFDLSGYDLVISSSHAESKSVITGPQTLHISYCHTPTRYYWADYHWYIKNPRYALLNPLVKLFMPLVISDLRLKDFAASDRVDVFIANSSYVAAQIHKFYRKQAVVIHPPVDVGRFKVTQAADYYVVVSRLVPYKRIDLAVAAASELKLKLKVVGRGSELKKLEKLAGGAVEFISDAQDSDVTKIIEGARALIFPGKEDFGIAPLEAMAAGKPVIAYQGGGALDYVIEGKTGVLFKDQTVSGLSGAIKVFEGIEWDSEQISKYARNFSCDRFKKQIKSFIESELDKFYA